MNSTDIKTVELIVNNKQAKQKLEEINKQLEVARRKKHEAFEYSRKTSVVVKITTSQGF